MRLTRPVYRSLPTQPPSLRFTPYAWAKLQFFCHAGDTEIGGFGISHPHDALLIIDFVTIKQKTTSITVKFNDEAVANYFEDQVEAGRKPAEFARIWCHTHPGTSPNPSCVDEDTLAGVFGRCDWAVMFILAKGGKTYARLHHNTTPATCTMLPVEIDYDYSFAGSDHETWAVEYKANVEPEDFGTFSGMIQKPMIQAASKKDEVFGATGTDNTDFWKDDTPMTDAELKAEIDAFEEGNYGL